MKHLFLFIVIGLFTSSSIFAQSSVDKKLKDVKGDIKKITITTDKGDVTFEGDDAKALAEKLQKKEKKIVKVEVKADNESEENSPHAMMHGGKMKKVFIINDDTLKCPEMDMSEFKFNHDSLMKNIQCDIKLNMKNLDKCMKSLRNRVIIIEDNDDACCADDDDACCAEDEEDAAPCSGMKSENESSDCHKEGGHKIEKKIIIKKHMKDSKDLKGMKEEIEEKVETKSE